jgi:hypothetical protein
MDRVAISILSVGLLLACEHRSGGAGVNPEGTTSAAVGSTIGGTTDAAAPSSGPTPAAPWASLRARLPALREDRAVVAALWTTDNGPRGETSIEMQIIDVVSDRRVDGFQVTGPFDEKPRHPVGAAAANAYLEGHRWLPLTPMTIEEDRGAARHKTDVLPEGAQARANEASLAGVTLRYREPTASIHIGSKLTRRAVPRWSGKAAGPDCPPPWGSIGSAWVNADAGVAVVEVTYQGYESDVCWMADSTVHALAWK